MPWREVGIVGLLAAVNLVNILDFVMVLPLGPDFAKALDIRQDQVGVVAAAYTAAAAITGLVGAGFLDRFDRRKVLAVAMIGLVCGTAAGGLAQGFWTMVAARALAGAFGGPATAATYAIVADAVPPERRGRALGAMMWAFGIAQILGVPLALKISEWTSWRGPFLTIAGLGIVLALGAVALLPPMDAHLRGERVQTSFAALVGRPTVRWSWLLTFVTFAGPFVLIPALSGYVQFNLGYPRKDLFWLYLLGGLASTVTTPVSGWLVDRYGSAIVNLVGTVLVAIVLLAGFVVQPPLIPVMLLFAAFMVTMGIRNVGYAALVSKVPGPSERARFGSIQSTLQHLGSAVATGLSALVVVEVEGQKLAGVDRAALLAVALCLLVPPLVWNLERRVVAESA